MVTKRPTGYLEGTIKTGMGNYGSKNTELHLNLPSFGDIATKIDFISQHQDATIENPLEGAYGWNYFDRTGLRFSAETARLYFTADAGVDKNTPFYSQLLNFDPLDKGLDPLPSMIVVEGSDRMKVADIGVPQDLSRNDTAGAGLIFVQDTPFGFEFKSISSFRKVDSEQWDNSGGAHRPPTVKPLGVFSRYSLSKLGQDQVSQEFQIVGSTDMIDYVGGVYYFKENAWEEAATPSTNQWNADLTGYTINDPSTWAYENWKIDRGSRATSESLGAFGQATYHLGYWHFTLGGRQTVDKKNGVLYKVKNLDADWQMHLKSSRFNPLAIISYEATEDLNVYAKYATGYRSGGASSRSLSFNEFGPEDVKSWELGAKYESSAARMNLALFTTDRTGSQIDFSQVNFDPITQTTRNTLETLNAPGVTKINGFEVDGQFALTDNLQVRAAYTYTDAQVPDTVNPFTGELQNVFIVFTPKNVYNVGVDYSKYFSNFMLAAHFDITKTDAAHAFSEYDLMNDAHTIANASISLEDFEIGSGIARLQFWVRNLTDEAYVYRRDPAKNSSLGTYGNFNAPRTYGVSFGYDF
jgi:iron complex outermembrane receptor protein